MTGAEEALSYPPHVTLRTGFLVPDDEVGEFLTDFGNVIAAKRSFLLRAFGLLAGTYQSEGVERRIIGFRVELNEALEDLHESLLGYTPYAKGPQYPYRPHLTLAFHDLDERAFEASLAWLRARPELAESTYEWRCDNVCLYSRLGWEWMERKRYILAYDATAGKRAKRSGDRLS
jgi:2'-5' RNA ligase